MKKLLWRIFPKSKKGWEKYFDWCLYHSKTFYPAGKFLDIYAIIAQFITILLVFTLLILFFPLTRIELRICSSKAKKQKEKEQND